MSSKSDPAVSHVTRTRVRYPETDRMGVAYHAHYLVWFELGRTELFRELGYAYERMEREDKLFFPVIEAGVRYLRSARYDDWVRVETSVADAGGVRVSFAYRIVRELDGELLATGTTVHAAIDESGKPVRLPQGLRELLTTEDRS